MAKKQTNSSTISANIAAAAAAAVHEEKSLLFAKRTPVAKKHAKAKVEDVFTAPVAVDSPVLVEVPVLMEEVVVFEETASEETTPTTLETPSPDRAKIAKLAYSYWEDRGCQGGYDQEVQDWLRAEAALQL